ncbi:MAG: GTPase ObgE [Caldisericales bacterium]|nr:GTPase ObgE [Caldisericales bacterium]
MFVDEVTIKVAAGKGGDGVVTFRREKFVPRGGPSGGKGGHGGDVYLVADSNLRDLSYLVDHVNWKAEDGVNGSSENCAGAAGDDIYIKVPVGVAIYLEDKDNLIAELLEDKQELLVAKGGRGGLGNANFANARRQAPHIATAGERGEKAKLIIELKILADVGLVGMPNAGKSTLLGAISRASPKIGDYPFTTLEPSLGVITTKDWNRFTVADIPGLIEGASQGKGLGFEFLRHVERCRVLLYLIDLASDDPCATLEMLWREVKLYSEETFLKPAFVVGNKIDLMEGKPDPLEDFISKRNIPYLKISAKERIGTENLIDTLWQKVKDVPLPQAKKSEEVIIVSKVQTDTKIERSDGGEFLVKNSYLERIVAKTDLESLDGLAFVYKQMNRFGIEKKLKQMGIKEGDKVTIAGKRFTFE